MTNLEEEIAGELSRQMCSHIDFQILSDMLVQSCGWYKVEIIHRPANETVSDILDWIKIHCKGRHMKRERTYLFEKQGDAVNFTLKWL